MISEHDMRLLVKWWQGRLLLQDWDLRLYFSELEDQQEADCEALPEYRRACLRFDLSQITMEKAAWYVVHELMHCHVEPLARHSNRVIEEADPAGAGLVKKFALDYEEGLVSDLATILVRMAEHDHRGVRGSGDGEAQSPS